jgi:hypothetical protein
MDFAWASNKDGQRWPRESDLGGVRRKAGGMKDAGDESRLEGSRAILSRGAVSSREGILHGRVG